MANDYGYASAVEAIRPSVNHARTPDQARRYAVTVNGITRFTDSPANVARWTVNGGTVVDRGL